MTLDEQVFFGGQPSEAEFKLLADRGVKTILNLRTATETEDLPFNEEEVVTNLGMRYIHIPIGRERAEDATLNTIIETIRESQEEKLMIHCASGSRVGFAWSLYQGAEGANHEYALAEGKAAGLRAKGLQSRAREYLQP